MVEPYSVTDLAESHKEQKYKSGMALAGKKARSTIEVGLGY